jgi:mono/diheme cytochrome c family protein
MQTRIGTILVALALVAIQAALQPTFAEEPASAAAVPSSGHGDAQLVAEGRALYAHHCSHCHGFNMVNPGTVSYDLRQFPHDQKSRFVSSVTNGKNGRMPQWGDVLSREEIDKLWAYVETGGVQ